MSISTGSCCSIASCLSGSDVRQGSDAVKNGWKSELEGRIFQFPGLADAFIDQLLPQPDPDHNSTSFPAVDGEEEEKLDALFNKYNPEKGQEVREYPALLKALNALVATFPDDKRLTMADTHGKRFEFPFSAFKENHHWTYPDITVSFPGKTVNAKLATWKDISMVMEVKADEKDDPFAWTGSKHTDTVLQLAKNARNLLLAHGFLSAFVIGIYGRTVRLARFDHSCAVVAPPISLAPGEGGVQLLKKFLWHFVHPMVGNTVVGCDPTVAELDSKDQDWVKEQLEAMEAKNWKNHVVELEKGRRVEVYDQKTGRCVPYLLYHLVDVNGRLFSRATMVWRAIEDTRILKDEHLVCDPSSTKEIKPRILKESWRQLVRTAESEFYERLDAMIQGKRRGIATMECGGDIGVFEQKWQARTALEQLGAAPSGKNSAHQIVTTELSDLHESYLPFSSTGSGHVRTTIPPAPDHLPAPDYPLPHTQHQTYSWRLLGAENWHRERSHMRIVLEEVGRPLTEFITTRELVFAIRDAIYGHKQAWEKARVLHRDLSLGNILILDERADDEDEYGFMHDLDYSAMEPIGADGVTIKDISNYDDNTAQHKERTGTYYFMALDLINTERPSSDVVLHHPHHDLESAYWVLLWVILRHTDCKRRGKNQSGKQACASLFKWDESSTGYALKQIWVTNMSTVDVTDNVPLTTLMTRFVDLICQQMVTKILKKDNVLTHDVVLALFDEALALDGWPVDSDWVPCKVEGDFDIRSVNASDNLAVVVPGGSTIQSKDRVHRSNPVSRSLRDAAILAGIEASLGHQPAPLPRLPTPSNSGRSQIASGSSLKRSRGDTDQIHHPSEVPTAPKRSKSTAMDPPPLPNAAMAESSSQAAGESRKRRSGRIAAKNASGSRPSGKA